MSSSQTSAGRDSGGPFVNTVPNYLADFLVFRFFGIKIAIENHIKESFGHFSANLKFPSM